MKFIRIEGKIRRVCRENEQRLSDSFKKKNHLVTLDFLLLLHWTLTKETINNSQIVSVEYLSLQVKVYNMIWCTSMPPISLKTRSMYVTHHKIIISQCTWARILISFKNSSKSYRSLSFRLFSFLCCCLCVSLFFLSYFRCLSWIGFEITVWHEKKPLANISCDAIDRLKRSNGRKVDWRVAAT